MKIILTRSILVLLLTFLPFIYSCDTGINIFSLQDDAQLGQELSTQIENDPQEYPIFHGDPSIKSYIVSQIFNQILQSPQVQQKNVFNYQMEIIDDDSTLNAFALPGGYIYVYSGLLKYLTSSAALAGVLGHEIAHAELRHATQRMTANYGVSILLNIVLGQNPSQLEEIAANLFVGLGFLANSRSDEDQADQYSIKYLTDTRFYPGSVMFFFEEMRDDGLISSNANEIATFLSTHPDPIDRINKTQERLQQAGIPIKSYNDTGNDILHEEYQQNVLDKFH
jgi:predicted Zn-dependent protease